MSFFHKKKCHKIYGPPFGPVTNILLAQKFFFVLALISGTEVGQEAYKFFYSHDQSKTTGPLK